MWFVFSVPKGGNVCNLFNDVWFLLFIARKLLLISSFVLSDLLRFKS